MSSENDNSFKAIDRKLTILINLMAYHIVEGKTQAEGAPILKRLGLRDGEIAAIFNSTAKAISVSIAVAKRKKAGSKGK